MSCLGAVSQTFGEIPRSRLSSAWDEKKCFFVIKAAVKIFYVILTLILPRLMNAGVKEQRAFTAFTSTS